MRLSLPNGRHVLRFFVAPESAPDGAAMRTPPVVVRVH
jgi:hypothetical protein